MVTEDMKEEQELYDHAMEVARGHLEFARDKLAYWEGQVKHHLETIQKNKRSALKYGIPNP